MINGSGSTQQLATPGTGKLKGLLSGGAGGGDKPPQSVQQLDDAGRGSKRPAVPTIVVEEDEREPFRCSSCESFYISEEELHCHIRRCHVPRSWRRDHGQAPSVEKRLCLGGHTASTTRTREKDCFVISKHEQEQKQQPDKDATVEALARPAVKIAFDLNNPAPDVAEENRSGV